MWRRFIKGEIHLSVDNTAAFLRSSKAQWAVQGAIAASVNISTDQVRILNMSTSEAAVRRLRGFTAPTSDTGVPPQVGLLTRRRLETGAVSVQYELVDPPQSLTAEAILEVAEVLLAQINGRLTSSGLHHRVSAIRIERPMVEHRPWKSTADTVVNVGGARHSGTPQVAAAGAGLLWAIGAVCVALVLLAVVAAVRLLLRRSVPHHRGTGVAGAAGARAPAGAMIASPQGGQAPAPLAATAIADRCGASFSSDQLPPEVSESDIGPPCLADPEVHLRESSRHLRASAPSYVHLSPRHGSVHRKQSGPPDDDGTDEWEGGFERMSSEDVSGKRFPRRVRSLSSLADVRGRV